MNMKIKKLAVLAMALGLVYIAPVMGGDWSSEEQIKNEISFMAKKLLDMSGEDSCIVESAPYIKPYLGICSEPTEQGIAITCVTPESQADIGGLRTGDVVTQINNKNMVNTDLSKTKDLYYGIVKNMKTDDILKITVVRVDKTIDLKLAVGAVSHPGYVLKITK